MVWELFPPLVYFGERLADQTTPGTSTNCASIEQHKNNFESSFNTQALDANTKSRRYRPESLISRPAFCRSFFVFLAMRSPQCTRPTQLLHDNMELRKQNKSLGGGGGKAKTTLMNNAFYHRHKRGTQRAFFVCVRLNLFEVVVGGTRWGYEFRGVSINLF